MSGSGGDCCRGSQEGRPKRLLKFPGEECCRGRAVECEILYGIGERLARLVAQMHDRMRTDERIATVA